MQPMVRSARAAALLCCGALALSASPAAFAQAAGGGPGSAPPSASQTELVFWQSVADSRDRNQLEAYLTAFPQGLFAGLARAKIASLAGATRQPDPPAPAMAGGATPLMTTAPAANATRVLASAASAASGATAPLAVSAAAPASAAAQVPAAPVVPSPPVPLPVPALDAAFVDQLRAMALAQGSRYQIGSVTLPPRPELPALEPLQLPAAFCSPVERNAFFETRYKAAIDRAGQNNALTIAHMELLGHLFAEARERGDSNASNTLAQESKSYEPIARAAFAARSALDPVFGQIMAIPLGTCERAAP